MTDVVGRSRRPTSSASTGRSNDTRPNDTGAIVFTDIVGFTELTDLHGDDVALALVEHHATLARASLGRTGRVVKEIGDGLMLWFDDAAEALRSALGLQGLVAATPPADGLPMWVRIGIHWGTPRRRGDDIIGRDVNLASRVTDLAGPGEVLCTEAAVRAATSDGRRPADLAFEFLGATYVKGVADPVPVHRVAAT